MTQSTNMLTNLDYLNKITESNQEMMCELIGIFKEQVLEMGGQLKDACEKQEWDKLSKLAHKAKSNAAIVGLNDLAQDLRDLEIWAAERKQVESYGEIVEKFIFVIDEALKELKEYL